MFRVNGVVAALVLFAIACPLSILAQLPAVLDTSGQALRAGTEYYILPSGTINRAGGVTLVSRTNPCPLFVGQENRANTTGLPVIFTPFSSGESTIRESNDFTIEFSASTICIQSTEWALESNPASAERTLLVTGRSDANRLYLRIDRDGDGYKLVFCPSNLCETCRPRCGDVGVYVENRRRYLALYEAPALPVVFRRA